MVIERQNIFTQLCLSLYHFKSYRGFAHTRGGKLFLYTLLMVCLTYVVTWVVPTAEFLPYIFNMDEATVDKYVPYFEISDGLFYIEEEVYYEDEGTLSMVIYATSDYAIPSDTAHDILRAYTQGFIISAEEMVIKQASGGVQSFSFSSMPDLSRDFLYDMIPALKAGVVVLYVLVFVVYIAVYLFATLFCALIGQFINVFVKAPVSFGAIFKVTAYARTAPIIIKMIFALFAPIGLHFSMFYVLFIVYMTLALIAVKRRDETSIEDQQEPLPF